MSQAPKIEDHLALRLKELLGKRPPTLCVAVSGGVDSVALLDLIAKMHPSEALTILHFNHLTRGQASLDDEAFVRTLGEKYKVAVIVGRRKNEGLSEAALRNERHRFLKEEAKKLNAYVVLGHHLDDQLETFFFRLIRGTQLKGLMGMREKVGRLLRPLLEVPKAEIVRYARENKLEYREDSSNFQTKYFRNRIRLDLMPVVAQLAESYGGTPAFCARFTSLTKESQSLLREREKTYDRILKARLIQTPYFDKIELKHLPKRHRKSGTFIRRLLETIRVSHIDRKVICQIKDLLAEKKGRVSIQGDLAVEISCGVLFFQSAMQRKIWENGVKFPQPDVPDGMEVRSFQPGDRIGSRKLKEEFLRRKIPRLERKLMPLLCRVKSGDVAEILGQVPDAYHLLLRQVKTKPNAEPHGRFN